MAEFDKGIVYKDREVIVKHTLYTDGIINTVVMGELVRCKDCIYPYICGVEMYCDHITGEEILVQPHEFCCWGVRKDGDNG